MRCLLDTNVVSELRKSERSADPRVRGWAARQHRLDLAISVVTVLEIEIGIGRVERRDVFQADLLRSWLEENVLGGFEGRILTIDLAVAREAASLHVPDPRPERDALIAATARRHDLTVVTRNERDFVSLDVRLLNPWKDA